MARTPIASLAVSAFAMAALTAAGPSNQTPPPSYPTPNQVGPWTDANPPPVANYDTNRNTMDAPQLFRFPSLSNKASANCMAGSMQTRSRPKVVATFPADSAVVRPGVVVVRVTFDQPMACDASFDGASDLPNPCPGRWREVTISKDRRSFRTVCAVKADTRYRLTLRSFRNSHGLTIPADVTFTTSGSAPIATILEALAEDTGAGMVAGG